MTARRPERLGVALVVVLAFVVLISGIVIAVFSRTTTMRNVSNSSCRQVQTDELARSALDIVVGSLRQEIVNGSGAETSGTCTLYIPLNASNMLPQRNGTWTDIPSLVRVSSPTAVPAPGVEPFLASNAATTATSANGRFISPTRWNGHYLVPRGTTSGSTIATPVSSFTAPSWVYVTDDGPEVLTSPTSSAMGRYAYAVYNQGGLLDMNVAGYPSTLDVFQVAQKGPLAFADVTRLGLSGSVVDNIVCWRAYATAQASGTSIRNLYSSAAGAGAYCNAVLANTGGLMAVSGTLYHGRTDQAFLSRQELLQYRNDLKFSQTVLQHMGTFSRAVTAPTCFHGVRFANPGTLLHYPDGGPPPVAVPVGQGDPLLHSRFSLRKLGWLTGAETVGSDAIQACFGVLASTSTSGSLALTYVGPGGSGPQPIESLQEVAAEAAPREPNFFELLKAGISGTNGAAAPTDAQIQEIGLNIISKYKTNGDCFRSVGGLGYVLDFWSAQTVCAPLLDLFSAVDEPAVSAGKVNLNAGHDMVFYAMFSNTATNDAGTATLADASALGMGSKLRAQLSSCPITDNSGLVAALASADNKQAALVALASAADTRTWSLLIDVIAQTGAFPKNCASLDRFVVQGERRFWLHVAIDRLTGKVVDRQLEPVYE